MTHARHGTYVALIVGFVLLAMSSSASAAQLRMRTAVDLARDAVVARAAAATLNGLGHENVTLTDVYRPSCRRVASQRATCRYRWTILDEWSGVILHEERGRVLVSRRLQVVRPGFTASVTRDADA